MQDQGFPFDTTLPGVTQGRPAPSVTPNPVEPPASTASAAEHVLPDSPDLAEKNSAPPQEADFEPLPNSFAEMGLAEDVFAALADMGFSEPMPVQKRVFRPVVAGVDLIVQSRTGSGKTAAYGIPFVQKVIDPAIDVRGGRPQVLVLGPTRELALQVGNEVGKIAARRKLSIAAVYGGAPMGRQVEALKAGAHLVSGTPGRVLDHLRRGTLHLSSIRALVLDEADEMLSMGFLEDITEILRRCPAQRQTLLFSATIPEDVLRLQHRYLRSPLHIQLSGDNISAAEIVHAYYMVTGMGRMRDLLRIIDIERPDSALVFCNTREETSAVAEFLRNHGHDAEPISSDLNQSERERVMRRMKAKELKFLVATDVAARGIDISDLPFVINYTFPESAEVYVHRTGRTGRAGKRGVAVSLISPRELGNFYYLKLTYKIRPEERTLPTETELQTAREGQYLDRLAKELLHLHAEPEFRSLVRRLLASETGETILALLLQAHLRGGRSTEAAHTKTERRSPRENREKDERRPTGESRSARERSEAPAPTLPPPVPVRVVDQPPEPTSVEKSVVVRGATENRAAAANRSETENRLRTDHRPGPHPRNEEDRRGQPARSRDDQRPRDRDRRPPRPETRAEARPETRAEARPETRAVASSASLGTDIIHTDDGREFWEAWADERAKHAKPAAPEAAVQPNLVPGKETETRRPRRDSRPQLPGEVRLYVNVGRRDGVDETGLRAFLSANGVEELPIEIHSSHTYLFVKDARVDSVSQSLSGQDLGGRNIICERARR